MPCAPGMRKCALTCAHRESVLDYRRERERQVTAIEQQIEREADEFDLINFKQWLIGKRNYTMGV